jgi:3-methyladenine DNA glycosylase AlkD
MPAELLIEIRRRLRETRDPAKATGMQAYMKSAMPYHGVPVPVVRKIAREVFRDVKLLSRRQWQELVLGLWRGAEFREERYASLMLAGHRKAQAFHVAAAMPMFEEMIVTGAWWDFVDDIATHRVADCLRAEPAKMKALMRRWSRDGNVWKRRTSILCQLHFKTETDTKLLYDCIAPSLESEEFFLRKAIGWALRQYARAERSEALRARARGTPQPFE